MHPDYVGRLPSASIDPANYGEALRDLVKTSLTDKYQSTSELLAKMPTISLHTWKVSAHGGQIEPIVLIFSSYTKFPELDGTAPNLRSLPAMIMVFVESLSM